MDHPPTDRPPQIETDLQTGPVSIEPLDWPADCGAEACFLGRTRSEVHPEMGALQRLEYEVYEPMVRSRMRQLAQEAAARFDCRRVRMVHAMGPVQIGQASVVIQVAAPHRGEAFAACRHLIDTLKHDLPIWKREIWQHGETFVEGCCAQSRDSSSAADATGRTHA